MHAKIILALFLGMTAFLAVQADHHHDHGHDDHEHEELTLEKIKEKIKDYADKTPVDQLTERVQAGRDYLLGKGARPSHLPARVDRHLSKLTAAEKQELADYLLTFLH
uniref:Theromyzin n=1 Tax=Theromyzon tessulatum TaxID=13286 RepID=THMYZ_THETS|nr:RecName: Full=Theromyzin; Flags: Precursor [Theromyzon tessulatum]AAR12066.1 theromyzin [Theromyzon tessulatum]